MDTPRTEGELIGERYRIKSPLGEGGMAWVYEAHDEYLNRRVALKELKTQMSSMSARFEREARVAGALQHPAVVKVFGYGMTERGAYIVFEYVEGETLAEMLTRVGPMPVGRVAALLRPVIGALAEAHEQGVIHRDLKPENLIVQRGSGLDEHVRLLDFGIAALSDAEERLTREGEVFGTPHFMSPQQIQGKEVTGGADVWAMGVVIYNMLTGQLPFAGPHAAAIMFKVVNAPPPPLPEGLDSRFVALVERCLDKSVGERFEDARALLPELEAFAPVSPWDTAVQSVPKPQAARPKPSGGNNTEVLKTQILRTLRRSEPRWLIPGLAGAALFAGLMIGLALGGEEALVEAPPAVAAQGADASTAEPLGDAAAQGAQLVGDPLDKPLKLLEQGKTEAAKVWFDINPKMGTPAERAHIKGLIALEEESFKEAVEQLSRAARLDERLRTDKAFLDSAFAAMHNKHGGAEVLYQLLGGPLFSPEVEARLQALAGDNENHVRWRAMKAIELGKGDVRRAKISFFTRNLESRNCRHRINAARFLEEHEVIEALPALEGMRLNAGNFWNRCNDRAARDRAIKRLEAIKEAGGEGAPKEE